MFASALLAAVVLLPSAFAKPFITAPVASTSWAAGTPQTVQWQDDGSSPSLAQFGNCSVGIYVGSATVQVRIDSSSLGVDPVPAPGIVPSVNVSTTSAITFTPDASIGPNGADYFLRFTSLALMDGQYPAEAFSAKFTLSSMSGQFNASISSQIAAGSSAPAGASSTPASSPTTSHAGSSSAASSSHSGSPTGSAAAAANKNGAMSVSAGPLAGVACAAVAVLGAMFL
ncbi:hypothetical protein B0H21DRAFT_780045 [Amylocystis lapponica]|nr:hypothetical protein B0H21DRAFT_780045 [Amylocystis lapponica]